MTDVAGYCPMGCGQTLFVANGGYITCRLIDCPRPDAVSTLLADRETEHIVEFGADVFTVKHPLRERINDDVLRCALHEHIAGLSGPPVQPGRYRARPQGSDWTWESIPPAVAR